MPLSKLPRSTLVDQIVDRLTAYIYEQALKPGDILPAEGKLAEELGVSRPVMREAIKIMAGQHIVRVENGRGAVIQPIDSKPLNTYFRHATHIETQSVLELMEIREALEAKSAALAASRCTKAQLQRLDDIVTDMAGKIGNLDAYSHADLAFHLLIAEAAHNVLLFNLIESIREATRNAIELGLSRRTPQELPEMQHLHEDIYRQIAAGNASSAAQAMRDHFASAIANLTQYTHNPQETQDDEQ